MEVFHPKSSTLRLYTKQKVIGQKLVRVKATIQHQETSKFQEYIRKRGPNDDLISECLWQPEPSEEKWRKKRDRHGGTSP